jgi:hypothetical protein
MAQPIMSEGASGASGASDQSHADPVTARDLLDRVDKHARNWHSLIDSVLETHGHAARIHPEPLQPLPQWAVDRLEEKGQFRASFDEYIQLRDTLRESLDLSAGEGSNKRYEIWDPRPNRHFVRLEIRSESLVEAQERLATLKPKYPNAYIAQVDVRDKGGAVYGPELLHTLVGRIWHAGTFFPREGDEVFEIQDATGRTLSVEASFLRAHPIFERLSDEAKESVEASLQHTRRKIELCAEAAANSHEMQR